jgi:hypothetical protein
MDNEFVGHGRKRQWPVSKYVSNIYLNVLSKTIKTYQNIKISFLRPGLPKLDSWTQSDSVKPKIYGLYQAVTLLNYSKGARFEYWSRHRLHWPDFFVVCLSPS